MQPIRVLLANPHPIVRNELRSLLERDSRIRVIGEAANGRETLQLAEYLHPELAIIDVTLSSIRAIDAARIISSKQPKTKVVILGALAQEGYVREAFLAGARAYVLEDSAQTDLFRAVFAVASGGIFLSPLASGALFEDWNRRRDPQQPPFARQDKQLFSLLAEGRPEVEIAQLLRMPEDQVHSACEEVRRSMQRFGLTLLNDP